MIKKTDRDYRARIPVKFLAALKKKAKAGRRKLPQEILVMVENHVSRP